jgi:hypothetical protein
MYVFLIDKKENIKITKLYLDIVDQEIYPQWILSSVFLYNKYILTMKHRTYIDNGAQHVSSAFFLLQKVSS